MKMTKISILLASCCLLGACAADKQEDNKVADKKEDTKNDSDKKEDNKKEGTNNDGNEPEALVLENNTPQSWIDLFTFTNVTIEMKYNLSILTDHDFKCVDGKWYCKDEGTDSFISHDGRNIFDLYLCHYSAFTYNSEEKKYSGTDWIADESGYVHSTVISLNENNRISSITDTLTQNGSSLGIAMGFSKYGETTLD